MSRFWSCRERVGAALRVTRLALPKGLLVTGFLFFLGLPLVVLAVPSLGRWRDGLLVLLPLAAGLSPKLGRS